MPLFSGPEYALSEADRASLRAAEQGGTAVVLNALEARLEFESEEACREHMARLAQLPRRTLPVMLAELPDWLAGMGPEDPVRVFDGQFDRLEQAGFLQSVLGGAIARQAAGRLEPGEVAHVLAALLGVSSSAVLQDIQRAFDQGQLKFWANSSPILPIDPAEEARKGGMHTLSYGGNFTTPEAVDAWLDAVDPQRRLPRWPADPLVALQTGEPGLPEPKREGGVDRQRRRYDALLVLGGKLERTPEQSWRIAGKRGCLRQLAEKEKSAGHPYSDPSDVSKDIKEEAERRRSSASFKI